MSKDATRVFSLVILASTLSVAVSSTGCHLKVSEVSATLSYNANITVLCDASCFGMDSRGTFGWYNKNNEMIERSGRIFSMKYNRGKYARLVIRNYSPDDAGAYVCSKTSGGRLYQTAFTVLNARDVIDDLHTNDLPNRGDIYIQEPHIPEVRAQRSVLSRVKRQDGSEQDDTMPTASGDMFTPTVGLGRTSTLFESTVDDTNAPTAVDSSKTSPTMEAITSPNSNLVTNPEVPTTEHEQKPESKLPVSEQAPDSEPASKLPESEPTPDTEPESKLPESEPPPDSESGPNAESEKKPSSTPQNAGTTAPNGNMGPPTEFGRKGLIAFLLALAVAFLLMYALLLVVCIPRFLKYRKAKSLDLNNGEKKEKEKKEKKKSKKEKNVPEAITLSKLDGNGLPSPGPSDAGFTTIDLDEQVVKKETKEETKSEPQSDNKTPVTDVKEAEGGAPATDVNTKDQTKQDLEKAGEESLLNSVMLASVQVEAKAEEKIGGEPTEAGIKFIDETQINTQPAASATPTVIDEPLDTTTKTTEVRLDIVEAEDGHKQIKLSTSEPPPLDDLPPPSPDILPPPSPFDSPFVEV